jgi:hypothetical protein
MRALRLLWAFCVLWLAGAGQAALAIDASVLPILLGAPGWVLPGAGADLNFGAGQYWGLTPGQLNTSRASSESEVCGVTLYTFASNVAPITPGCGLWSWESRTNSIRNGTATGAVNGQVGVAGSLPTNWDYVGSGGVLNGTLALSVVGTGTVNGIPYIDLGLNGTPAATTNSNIYFDSSTGIPASYGQTWTVSALLSATNLTNFSVKIAGVFRPSGAFTSAALPQILGSTLVPVSASTTIGVASAAYIQPSININYTAGQAVAATVRVALPQTELNPNVPASIASATVGLGGSAMAGAGNMTLAYACATPPVLAVTTSGGVVNAVTSVPTPGACAPSIALPQSTYNVWIPGAGLTSSVGWASIAAGGTGYGASLTGTLTWSGAGCSPNPVINVTTNSSGAIATMNSVPTPGACSTWPASSATTWTAGGGLSAGSGAQLQLYSSAAFALTPTDNSAQGFATGPIPTSAGSTTRAATTISATVPFGPNFSLECQATPSQPFANIKDQECVEADDGTNNNAIFLARRNGGAYYVYRSISGSFLVNASGGSWSAGVFAKEAMSISPSVQLLAAGGGAIGSNTLSMPTGLTTLHIGSSASTSLPFNGVISRITLWSNTALGAAQLNAVTK